MESDVYQHWFIRASHHARKDNKSAKNNVPTLQSRNEVEDEMSTVSKNNLKNALRPVSHHSTITFTRPAPSAENSWTPTVTKRRVTGTEVW